MVIPIGVKDYLIVKDASNVIPFYLSDSTYNKGWTAVTTDNTTGAQYPGGIHNRFIMIANTVTNGNLLIPTYELTSPTGLSLKYNTNYGNAGLFKQQVAIFGGQNVHGESVNPAIYTMAYYMFYRANAILKNNGTNVLLNNNISYPNNGALNPIHTLDWSESFAEAGSSLEILKEVISSSGSGPIATVLPAVVGTDYELISSSATSMQIRLLTENKFIIKLTASGYHSNNHPYPVATESTVFMDRNGTTPESRKVTSNNSIINFFVTVNPPSQILPSYNYDIRFPQINPSLEVVNPSFIKSTNPLTTYIMVDVNIKPDVLTSTALYTRTSTISGTTETISLTDQQWVDLCTQDLKVDLYIKNSNLSIHDSFLNIDLNQFITYSFYPDDNYEVYYQINLR